MVKKRRIKTVEAKQGNRFKSQEPPNYNNNIPKFSLEKLQSCKYCFSELDKENKAMFGDSIFKRKSKTWNEINSMRRHALGSEKIAKNSIRAAIPKFVTEDVTNLIAFRYHGTRVMVGYREKDVFYVLWFDHDFTLYKH